MIAEIASCILSQYLWYRESIQVLRERVHSTEAATGGVL